jgi:hypothetical protein
MLTHDRDQRPRRGRHRRLMQPSVPTTSPAPLPRREDRTRTRREPGFVLAKAGAAIRCVVDCARQLGQEVQAGGDTRDRKLGQVLVQRGEQPVSSRSINGARRTWRS